MEFRPEGRRGREGAEGGDGEIYITFGVVDQKLEQYPAQPSLGFNSQLLVTPLFHQEEKPEWSQIWTAIEAGMEHTDPSIERVD